jgi:hypothetical protein
MASNDESYREINQPTEHGGDRNNQAGKINLGDQTLIGHQTVARFGQGMGK